ncbi:hypothetical protein BHE74_00034991 [Ensete ventricosum]|nr:hypothetical protein BHE74_00034991 [Ensete ventricosum]RZS11420.1 hypothetical protein BHM03_00042753 [Ensete ventricosum]
MIPARSGKYRSPKEEQRRRRTWWPVVPAKGKVETRREGRNEGAWVGGDESGDGTGGWNWKARKHHSQTDDGMLLDEESAASQAFGLE